MKKVWLILLAVVLVFALVFVGCGGGSDDEGGDEIPEGFEEIDLTLPDSTTAAVNVTGEGNSKFYKFEGEDFTKIKEANPGSYLQVTYKVAVEWGCGEIGWIDKENAGPTIHGDSSSSKTRTAKVPVEDLVLGTDNFTIHIFNNADVLNVSLFLAPEDYEVEPHPKATEGATKIWVPYGCKPNGKGDISKADIAKILAATSGNLVFHFSDDENTEQGILKFSPKEGPPNYNTSGYFGENEWAVVSAEDKTIKYAISDIKTKMEPANLIKMDVNLGNQTSAAGIVYMEIVP